MEVQPACRTSLWRSVGKTNQKLQEIHVRSVGNRSVTEDVPSTTMCLFEQTLNARPLTPVRSDVNDLESITPHPFLLRNKKVC